MCLAHLKPVKSNVSRHRKVVQPDPATRITSMPADIRLLIGAGVCVGYAWSRWVLHQRHASRVAAATVPHAPIPDFEIARFAGKSLHQVAVQDRWWPRACVDTTVLAAVVGPKETRVFVLPAETQSLALKTGSEC